MSQAEIVWAFVQQSQHDGQHVAFSKRGNSPRGYVNVFGPSHDPNRAETALIVIEHDGSISFKDAAVANALQAQPRATGATAPNTGAANWGLSAENIEVIYPSPDTLVAAIVAALRAHASW